MTIRFEDVDQRTLLQYEKVFFEEVCGLSTSGRDILSVPIPTSFGRAHFSCVQDALERLTAEWGGHLSKFQWRNCLFVPIDRRIKLNDVYMEVYDVLRSEYPSLFIRSYVYVIFVKVYGTATLGLDVASVASKNDLQIYAWNTNYEVRLQGKRDLFNLGDQEGADASAKVFIVSDPGRELRRIQDANSDVIDAVRAYLGELDMIAQTREKLEEVENALGSARGTGVLLEGPARSGKTIIAMSLLASHPNSKMLLMNWYFYDALRDAFKIWGRLDEERIKSLFSTDARTLEVIRGKKTEVEELTRFCEEPQLLDREILMRELPSHRMRDCLHWRNFGDNVNEDWRVTGIRPDRIREGDYILVFKSGQRALHPMRVTKLFPGSNSATAEYAYPIETRRRHMRLQEDEEQNMVELQRLLEVRDAIEGSAADDLIARTIKEIANVLSRGGQRFFHHDRRKEEGLWVDNTSNQILISDDDTLICDEAQRLGRYYGLDEVSVLSRRSGGLFLCGDDCQMLNRRGDLGMARLVKSRHRFCTLTLPESVGIPDEIASLVRCLLGVGQIACVNCDFEIGLVRSDAELVRSFEGDPSGKKHYAIPTSSGFYRGDYVPGIWKTSAPTPMCTNECNEFCTHRFIPMLPREISDSKFKFFCSEAVMPRFALSAYELISREVESIYLKIPWGVDTRMLSAPLDSGDMRNSWVKRHLYVLMTRATRRLIVEVEDRRLFDHFERTLRQAGIISRA